MKFFLSIILLLFFLGAGVLFWWSQSSTSPGNNSEVAPFVINPGASATAIGNKLAKEGFIRSSLAFKVFMQFSGNAGKIQAGDYRLAKNLSLPKLVKDLVRGPVALWVTIPEGFRSEEAGQKIAETLELTGDKRREFLTQFDALTKNKEGFLFPDTYLFFKNASASAVVARLTGNFSKKVGEEIMTQAKKQNLDEKELITLASIVERETRGEEERPVVAGILLKRLKANWALQTDATLQYIVATNHCSLFTVHCEWWEPVTGADKQLKSAYNTYANRGLPPGPIANPGLSSIKAAANPETSDYWFYLHDNEGKIHYAKTTEEHTANIQKYLR